ncbi:MAG: DUF58 domain-containing protein [Bacteroidota bacterium]
MHKLLDPKIMMAIKDLHLSAKTTIDGFMSGINKSTVKGQGLEFSQYRSYQPGDDLRALDWKMFARSDRYYIRESEIETNIAIRFLVDASASMNHNDGHFTKMDYSRYLIASLAQLASIQGDAIGLYAFKNSGVFAMPAKQDLQHLTRLFYQLEQLKPEGSFTKPIHYKEIFAGSQRRELMVFVSDFYQSNDEIFKLLNALNTLNHEILVFHVVSKNEMELDYKGYATFEDLETGKTIQVDQERARAGYRTKFDDYLKETRTRMLDHQLYYRLISTAEPLADALRDFLKQRNKLKI